MDVWRKESLHMSNCIFWLKLTLEVALDTRRCDTLRKDGGPSLNGPGNEHSSGVLVELLCDFVDGWVVDDTRRTVSYMLPLADLRLDSNFIPRKAVDVVAQWTVGNNEDVLHAMSQ